MGMYYTSYLFEWLLFIPEVFYKKMLDRGNMMELSELWQEWTGTEVLSTAKPLKAWQGGEDLG